MSFAFQRFDGVPVLRNPVVFRDEQVAGGDRRFEKPKPRIAISLNNLEIT